MKGDRMKLSDMIILFLTLGGLLLSGGNAAAKTNSFKLQPGAEGKLCLNCHTTFEDKLKSPFVHTPVKAGECIGCHNPHASAHGKLLAERGNDVCLKCHREIIPAGARSVHEAARGNCLQCHDPHAATNKFNLPKTGNDLCFSCHKEFGEALKKVKFKHNPVEKGCTACHSPHASAGAKSLLKEAPPGLCLKCHKTDKPSFAKQHMNYPVGKARCTTCHNPHGSNQGSILYDNVHKPVANKMCNQCHVDPSSPSPFATKKSGYELCKACHSTMINDAFSKKKLHWPLADRKGCLSCHNPHASPEKSLLKAPMIEACVTCHADTIARQARSQTKHPPIEKGQCTACHSPHASDNAALFKQASVVELCGTCHDWQKHSTHPLGGTDPRNKNLTVQCLSCHRAHGNENKAFLHFSPVSEMCTQCHTQYKR